MADFQKKFKVFIKHQPIYNGSYESNKLIFWKAYVNINQSSKLGLGFDQIKYILEGIRDCELRC